MVSVWCLGRSRDLVRCYALLYSGSQCHILRSCPPCLHVEHCGTLFHVDVLGVPFFILSCISNSRSARLWGSAKHARVGQGCRLLETIHHGWFICALFFFLADSDTVLKFKQICCVLWLNITLKPYQIYKNTRLGPKVKSRCLLPGQKRRKQRTQSVRSMPCQISRPGMLLSWWEEGEGATGPCRMHGKVG